MPQGMLTISAHQIIGQLLYLCVLHAKKITKDCIEKAALPFLATDSSLCYYHIIFLNHANDGNGWVADKCAILYFFVKGVFPNQMKCTGHFPDNVVRHASQYLLMIAFVETIHVPFHSSLFVSHRADFLPPMCGRS